MYLPVISSFDVSGWGGGGERGGSGEGGEGGYWAGNTIMTRETENRP